MDAPIFGAAGGFKIRTGVAFGGTQYLVAWEDARAAAVGFWYTDVYATRVTLDGAVTDPYGLRIGRGSQPAP